VLAGWSAVSVALGLLLCRAMRRRSHTPTPPAVLPWQASTSSSAASGADPAAEAAPSRTAASA
jgi:hypothetical protein